MMPHLEPLCGACGCEPRQPGQRWCRGCRTAYMRQHRARKRQERKQQEAEMAAYVRELEARVSEQGIGLSDSDIYGDPLPSADPRDREAGKTASEEELVVASPRVG